MNVGVCMLVHVCCKADLPGSGIPDLFPSTLLYTLVQDSLEEQDAGKKVMGAPALAENILEKRATLCSLVL